MMKNKQYKQKKNRAERKQYKNSLGERGAGIYSTYEYTSGMLSGSDNFCDKKDEIPEQKSNEPIEKKTVGARIHDWAKDKAPEIIITIIVIPFIIWIAKSIIDIQKEDAVNKYRLQQIEENISKMSDDIPSKEILRIELENLEEDIEELTSKDLEKRIEDLEESIDEIRS